MSTTTGTNRIRQVEEMQFNRLHKDLRPEMETEGLLPPEVGPSVPSDNESGDGGTRTPTSSPAKKVVDKQAGTDLVRGLVGLGFLIASTFLKKTRGLTLRMPTRDQVDDFAEPVGGIVARHVPMESLGEDLFAVIEAGTAVGDYALDGPLTDRKRPEARYAEDSPTPAARPLNTATPSKPTESYEQWVESRPSEHGLAADLLSNTPVDERQFLA